MIAISNKLRCHLFGISFLLISSEAAGADCFAANVEERLQNYCVLNNLGGAIVDDVTLRSLGERFERTATFVPKIFEKKIPYFDFDVQIAPTLQYSDNINGGNPRRNLIIGDLEFIGDEDYYAKDGILVGGSLGLSGNYVYERGRYFTFSTSYGYAFNPEFDLDVKSSNSELCHISHVKDWWYLDLCVSAFDTERDLGSYSERDIVATVTKLFDYGTGQYAMASLGAKQSFYEAFSQNKLVGSFEVISDSDLSGHFEIVVAEKIAGQFAQNFSISANVLAPFGHSAVSLDFGYSFSDGATFLGVDRADTSFQATVSFPIFEVFQLSLGYIFSDSTIDYFDRATPTIGIRLPPFQL